jgi:dCTP deaminase
MMSELSLITYSYVFEGIERVYRFYKHLDTIENQFYNKTKSNDKMAFVAEYKDCIFKILEKLFFIIKLSHDNLTSAEAELLIDQVHEIFIEIVELHKFQLIYLPRPSEPVELGRFKRIINSEHLQKTNKDSKVTISLFLTEEISEATYRKTALCQFKDKLNVTIDRFENIFLKDINIEQLVKVNNCTPSVERIATGFKNKGTIHITIPRIDSDNPCRWPTLLHEISHHILNDDFFKVNLLEDFKEYCKNTGNESLSLINLFFTDEQILHKWLIECWCDICGALVIGPSFWFSQYSAFLFAESDCNGNANVNTKEHPPVSFRLNLIYAILQHRGHLVSDPSIYDIMKKNSNLLLYLINHYNREIVDKPKINTIYHLFTDFFLTEFRQKDSTIEESKFKSDVWSYVKECDDIKLSTLFDMANDLSLGLPICSVRRSEVISNFDESPATPQEILLSAWIYRDMFLKLDILKDLSDKLSTVNTLNRIVVENIFNETINKSFSRFDEAVLRSIQVSEWFKLFYSDITNNIFDDITVINNRVTSNYGTLLVDYEIKELLDKKELRVIPLMDHKNQLGSSSLDVRLGTSFQIFHPTGAGYIDFTESKSTNTFEQNSKFIDLDFLESITIQPGQFVLGHTMEYVKFPDYVAAEIEGRSSFARMGIEVHMTAGFIDPGFQGVVTLEIYNAGSMPVRLYPGMRVAQIRFMPVNRPKIPYHLRHTSKYKGLLSHNYSLQNKDIEVTSIIKARNYDLQ